MPTVTTIKLTGENHVDIDEVCAHIRSISEQTGVKLRGPIPLPTRRLVVPCRKAPDGEGSETWDHWEMRIHKRLLELVIGKTTDESALRQVMRIPIPDTVTIELSLRTVAS
jgi:small subunit ribosomal protein S10